MTLLHRNLDPQRATGSPHVTIFTDRCAGCQECVIRCPMGALTMDLVNWIAVADDGRCVGCRQCERTCPFSAITVHGPLVVAERVHIAHSPVTDLVDNLEETRHGIETWEAVLAEADRCLHCPDPTCVRGCPAHNDIPAFISAVRDQDLEEAHRVIGRTSFLPDICSRVCDQELQCEGACTWSLAGGEPVAIGAIERFISDNAPVPPIQSIDTRARDLHIAVVGSGPAGIGAAYELVRSGAQVSVFDQASTPGGLLVSGIPDFTLPRAIADRPWQQLIEDGVRFVGGKTVTLDTLESLRRAHDAVLIATGAGSAIRLPIEGSDLDGVIDATTFLTEARAALVGERTFSLFNAQTPEGGPRPMTVLVLGAGNTAMDVARLARRLDAEAICIDWMDEHFAPVRPDELEEARAEGVDIRFQRTLTRLEGVNGRVSHAILSKTHQRRAGKTPKVDRTPMPPEPVDLVVMAMGYRIDPALEGFAPTRPITRSLPEVLDRRLQASGLPGAGAPAFARHRRIGELALVREIGRLSAALGTAERVYVAGDALIGPSSVVEAMAQGRRGAMAIIDHLARPHPTEQHTSSASVLIALDGRENDVARVADAIRAQLIGAGATVEIARIGEVGLDTLASADLVVLGTHVGGFATRRSAPAQGTQRMVDALPALGATRFATFCTSGFHARETLDELRHLLEAKGGHVVANRAFAPDDVSNGSADTFASELIDLLECDPDLDRAVEFAIAATRRMSPLNAALEVVTFVGGRNALLARTRDQLSLRLEALPGDHDLERALHIVELALRGAA